MLNFIQQLDTASTRLLQAVERIRELGAGQGHGGLEGQETAQAEALAFNLERAAWAMIEQAQAWVFELRLGLPRKETESFDLLQDHGWLELDTARRFKQLCEFRSLSSREPGRVDWHYLRGDLSAERALFISWNELVQSWKINPKINPGMNSPEKPR